MIEVMSFMKKMYEIHNKEIIPVEEKKKNFWIHLTNPTDEEIKAISEELQIEETVLRKTLDKSELPHIEIEENSILYVINIPYVILSKNKKKYRAFPFGIFLFEDGVLTVSTNNHPIIGDILTNKIPNLDFFNHDTFPIYMIGKSMEYYLKHLNEIQEDIRLKEKDLIKASSNKDLEHLLTLQKSLLYFTTSLQGNRAVLEKIENNNRLTSKEIDTLRDVQIEIKQGIEMANICREILENTMNTYSSIISNNLNDIMKFLTSITLVISIPTMIASFLGMNVSLGSFGTDPYSFVIIIALSFVIAIILIIILRKKNLL